MWYKTDMNCPTENIIIIQETWKMFPENPNSKWMMYVNAIAAKEKKNYSF